MKRNKLLARFIALHGVRNTELENLHAGISPKSKTADFSDVKVVTPYGEIEWKELSRISDKEMRLLMLDIEKSIYKVLETIPRLEKQAGSKKNFEKSLEEFCKTAVSWDIPDEKMIEIYGADYKKKFNIEEK